MGFFVPSQLVRIVASYIDIGVVKLAEYFAQL